MVVPLRNNTTAATPPVFVAAATAAVVVVFSPVGVVVSTAARRRAAIDDMTGLDGDAERVRIRRQDKTTGPGQDEEKIQEENDLVGW